MTDAAESVRKMLYDAIGRAPGDATSTDASVAALQGLAAKLAVQDARVKALEASVQGIRKRAQNNIDRSWNRALVAAKVAPARMDDLRKVVRHAEEFGHE